MSFGMHVAAAVFSVGGLFLALWLRDKKWIVGLLTMLGVLAGMWGLSRVPGADQTALLLWFVFGLGASQLVWTVRDVVVWYRRKRAAAGQPQSVPEPVEG